MGRGHTEQLLFSCFSLLSLQLFMIGTWRVADRSNTDLSADECRHMKHVYIVGLDDISLYACKFQVCKDLMKHILTVYFSLQKLSCTLEMSEKCSLVLR